MPSSHSDLFGAEALSPLNGSPLVLVDAAQVESVLPQGAICIAVDRAGLLPSLDPARFDALVTICPAAPAPWVSIAPTRLDGQLASVRASVARAPVAAALLARIVRTGAGIDFEAALELESLAYSTLLGGGEFQHWLATAARPKSGPQEALPVTYARIDDHVTLTLSSPGNRNAMTAEMRDALFEALANVLEDPSRPSLDLCGAGPCFSTGGDLAEFGTARDVARAHVIRTQRSCARLLHRLGNRATARLHGACIGSGIEVAAAAAHRVGAPDLIVQLPELRMGLIPGAGGTVSIGRAVGRHRLLWLALGGFRMGAHQALDWGLIHEIAA